MGKKWGWWKAHGWVIARKSLVNRIRPGLFWGACALGLGEGGEVPAAHNSKTIHGIEMKFGRVVENHKLINLV